MFGMMTMSEKVLILSEGEYNRLEEQCQRDYGMSLEDFAEQVFGARVILYDRIGGSDV